VPEGATPKDGPSAGITMATALLSLAREERIPRPLAMTGELTLTGQILPVGGIREKVTAARRSKVSELILPEDNRRDFNEVPEHLRQGLEVRFVEDLSHRVIRGIAVVRFTVWVRPLCGASADARGPCFRLRCLPTWVSLRAR